MRHKKGQSNWLIWALLFLGVALIAGVFGFGFISGISYTIARWLAIIFVILFIITLIAQTVKKA